MLSALKRANTVMSAEKEVELGEAVETGRWISHRLGETRSLHCLTQTRGAQTLESWPLSPSRSLLIYFWLSYFLT